MSEIIIIAQSASSMQMIASGSTHASLLTSSQARALRRLSELGSLEAGWHFGEGVPFKRTRIDQAADMLAQGFKAGFTEANVFPGPDGEIRVTFYRQDKYYEFTFEADDTIRFVKEESNQEMEANEVVSFESACERLRLELSPWKSSYGSSISRCTGTQNASALTAWPSPHPATVESHWWIASASRGAGMTCVPS